MSQYSTLYFTPTSVLQGRAEQQASCADRPSAATTQQDTSFQRTTQWAPIKDPSTQNNTHVPYYKYRKAVCFEHYHSPIKDAGMVQYELSLIFQEQNALDRFDRDFDRIRQEIDRALQEFLKSVYRSGYKSEEDALEAERRWRERGGKSFRQTCEEEAARLRKE
jgi:hypothetical protein